MRTRVLSLSLAVCLLFAAPAPAAGPLLVNGAGQPLAWTTSPIPYNPDRSTLGTLGNADAVAFVAARFATWSAVSTAAISFRDAGLLPADVTSVNVGQYFGICNDGRNPIIFDTDGSIIRNLFGIGNENYILGAAGPDCISYVPPRITEATAILNGRFIDGVSTQLNPEISPSDFGAVFTHEFGHYFGLDHSQINLAEASDANPANDTTIATMYPLLVNGTEQSTLTLDDRVSVSMLYPAAGFFSSSGSITGSIVRPDGSTLFQGAYVIARDVSNPRLNAVGVASGFLFNPSAPGGPPPASLRGYYEVDGLTPGASYTVEIEGINPQFRGGSAVGPLDPPASVPVPEFWNGAKEAATNPPDDPGASTPVSVTAGTPRTGIRIIMNPAGGVIPSNDLCSNATAVTSFPSAPRQDTTGGSESATDPGQTCTDGSKNFNTVWYALTPPDNGLLTVDACGSDYDTVLSAFTGSCASLTPIACNDDIGSSSGACAPTHSRLTFEVAAKQTYLVEVSQFGSPGGGTLQLNASLGPRSCAGGACLPGGGRPEGRECMTEWLLQPPPVFTKRPPKVIDCHDGDTCDADNDGTNYSCTFHVALCLNNHDPSLSCTPTDVTLVDLLAPRRNAPRNRPEDNANADALLASIAGMSNSGTVLGVCLNAAAGAGCALNTDCNSPGRNDGRCYRFVRFIPPASTPDRCGVSAAVVVPLRATRSGALRSVTKRIRLKATNSQALTERDALRLRCRPK